MILIDLLFVFSLIAQVALIIRALVITENFEKRLNMLEREVVNLELSQNNFIYDFYETKSKIKKQFKKINKRSN